jgi:FKBP-type peptidyl-prolyl cis-trans isomerase
MNKLSASLIVLVAVVSGCNKKVDLKDENQMISYAVGQQIGQNIKNTGVDLNTQVLAQAIKDATQGKNEMKPEEIQQAMTKLQENMQKKQTELADKNQKDGKDFLEKNKSAANVKTTDSGLQYTVEKEGAGKTPTKEDTVKVHYTGTLMDGTKFDSSVDRGEPAEFPVGGVIPGWTEALLLMKEGSKYKLVIPSDLAYGPSGRPGIPPNSVLLFDVELLEVKAVEAPAKKRK